GIVAASLLASHAVAQTGPAPNRAQGLPSTGQAAKPALKPAPDPAADDFALKATADTHLAYIVTGDAEVDNISKAGLQGLTLFLAQRTALEAGEPMGIDPARDELAFFPIIYWPVLPNAAKPSADT